MASKSSRSGEFWRGFFLAGALVCVGAVLLLVVMRQGGIRPTPSGQAGASPTAQVPQAVGSVVYPPPDAVETAVAHGTQTAISELEGVARATAYVATSTAIAEGLLPLRSVDHGSWRYAIYQSGGVMTVNIHYNDEPPRPLEDFYTYVEANKELARKLAARGDEEEGVTVFFNAISTEAFNDWATTSQVRVKEVELRVADKSGFSRGSSYQPEFSIYPEPSNPVPLDEEELGNKVREKMRQWPGVELKGVYSALVVVRRAQLSELAADPLPILVEVTPLVVRDELTADGVPDVEPIRINAPGIMYVPLDQLQPKE